MITAFWKAASDRLVEVEGYVAVGEVPLIEAAELETVFLGKGNGWKIFGLKFEHNFM
jgi:hypothetical protein